MSIAYTYNEQRTVSVNGTNTVSTYHYVSSPDGLVAIYVKQGSGAMTPYYVETDHLGSICKIYDASGNQKFSAAYDPWGKQTVNTNTLGITRGYCAHEHWNQFGLIDMNGRFYDPVVGRFLSPDPYVQDPSNPQNFNRYSYCLNNPLKYTDPSGEEILTAVIIGAVIGTYMGGTMANNTYNPCKWDYGSGKTWGYMAGGAIVGAASGYVGGVVAYSGMPLANTYSIMAASFTYSIGTSIYTNGQTPVSLSFGAASYNMTDNEWGYLGKKGNKPIENVGYSLGAMANVRDINNIIDATSATLYTQTIDDGEFDKISHSAYVSDKGETLMSYGPSGVYKGKFKGFALSVRPSTSNYSTHIGDGVVVKGLTLNKHLFHGLKKISELLPYQGLTSNCVNWASLGTWLNGIPNIGLHPFLLHGSMAVYNTGVYNILASQLYK